MAAPARNPETHIASEAGRNHCGSNAHAQTPALEQGLPDNLGETDDSSDASASGDEEQRASVLANLHNLADRPRTMSEYDRRIDAQQQLATLYGQWSEILNVQLRAALHAIVVSSSKW